MYYYFSVAAIKHHDPKADLWKKEFSLAYGFRVIRIHHGKEAWWQAAGVMAGAGG